MTMTARDLITRLESDGIPVLRLEETSDPLVEDDLIVLEEDLTLQVGAVLSLVREEEGCFLFLADGSYRRVLPAIREAIR